MLEHAVKKLGFRAAGDPFGEGVCVGDYGVLQQGRFRFCGNVRTLLGLDRESWDKLCTTHETAPRNVVESGTSVLQGAGAADVNSSISGNVSVKFDHKGSCVLFTGPDVKLLRVVPSTVATEIWEKRRTLGCGFRWRWETVIVWEVLESTGAVYFESQRPDVHLGLSGDCKFDSFERIGSVLAPAAALQMNASAMKRLDSILVSAQGGRRGALGLNLFQIKSWGDHVNHRAPKGPLPNEELLEWEPKLGPIQIEKVPI